MSDVILENLTIDFPIYGTSHRELRKMLVGATGGLIRREGRRRQRVSVCALDDISIRLRDGDRVGLIGHNGAGKSTLLRVLAGIYEPALGKITINGRISPLFVAAPGMDGDYTGYENIHVCGMHLGMSAAEIERKLPEIVAFSELGDYLSLPVRTYSAGMQMRLSFALATAVDPDVLLLDEGLGAGDFRFTARAEKRLEQLIARSSILVFASHSNALVTALCNKAALLERGRLIGFGPIDEIIELYESREMDAQWVASAEREGPN